MEEFELLRYVTIGQYLPTNSMLHRLDPRVKLIALGMLALALVAQTTGLGSLLGLGIVLALVALARVDVRVALRGLAPSAPILVFLALLQLGFGWSARTSGCVTLWRWEIVHVTTCSVEAVMTLWARLVALVLLTSLVTFTSTLSELARGIEWWLRPFQRLGVPADELAMVFMIALRFVPTLALEMEKLLKAQAARGANIHAGTNPITRTRQWLPILVPLFINTLRRSEDLAAAMEARGYLGGAGRTHYVRLHWRRADTLALAVVMLMVIGLITVR